MNSPKSRLLTRLDAALARSRQPVTAACLRAERAGHLARKGRIGEARTALAALHDQFRSQPVAAVSVWLCIAEGWMLHAGGELDESRDKLKRAQALSAASGMNALHALASAWLAHLDHAADESDAMLRNLSLALGLAATDHHAARARACMVMALAYHAAGRFDRAQPWYVRSREHASAEGDEVSLSTLNHNLCTHRADQAMQAAVFGGDALDHARQALAGADATANFDAWVGAASPDALGALQRAGIASVQGQYGDALALYEGRFSVDGLRSFARHGCRYLADAAWCRWHLGDSEGAARDARSVAAVIDASTRLDDRAVAHGRLAVLFRMLGDAAAGDAHDGWAQRHWSAHREQQAALVCALDTASLCP